MKSTMAQAQSNWEADKMLDVYIHDYFMKRKLHATAKAFMAEGKVSTDPVAIDAPGGFLYEWWSVFWDIFISRTNEKHSEPAAAYIETQQTKAREQQLQMQQLQLMQQRSAQLQRRDPNHPALSGSLNTMNSEGMLGQPPASVLAMKMYEERMKNSHSMDSETTTTLIDANRMALLKSATSHQGQLVHGNSGNMTTALQQLQARSPLTPDIKGEVSLGATPKSLPIDTSVYRQAILQSKSGLGSAGLNQGVTSLPLKGWPLTGIDQLRPSLGVQVPKHNLTTQSQFLASQQQQVLAQAQAQNNLGNSTSYGDMDPRRLSGLPRGSLSAKDGQSTRNDGSICSQVQSGSPKQMKMAQTQHSLSQQQDQLQQQQLQQNNRKRKQHSSSGPANSTGTGNTVGPSPNSPPSTHTPGDGINTASSVQHVNSVQKSMMMYGTDGTGGLASSNLMEDMERFGDIGALDDNVESFLSNDAGEGGNLYGTIKQSPAEQQKESSKSFTFAEFGCIRTRNSKVTCCHFSSDGKLLASAGHDRKVILWNMDTLQTESTAEEHNGVISDVRFRPNSSQLATASIDQSVRLWDAANPGYSVKQYSGHSSGILSLDFHPQKTDILCFCDEENEIRYWNTTTSSSCTRASKGGTAQVRFQPRVGHVLAASSDKTVSIFDVETNRQIYALQPHPHVVNCICWDGNGDVLATVSQNMVKIWSLSSGDCIQELSTTTNQFYSCVFHPSYSTLLVIGGMSALELWNMAENKSMTITAHEDIICGLAQSPVTGMVASASHDGSLKLWK